MLDDYNPYVITFFWTHSHLTWKECRIMTHNNDQLRDIMHVDISLVEFSLSSCHACSMLSGETDKVLLLFFWEFKYNVTFVEFDDILTAHPWVRLTFYNLEQSPNYLRIKFQNFMQESLQCLLISDSFFTLRGWDRDNWFYKKITTCISFLYSW